MFDLRVGRYLVTKWPIETGMGTGFKKCPTLAKFQDSMTNSNDKW